MTPTTPPVPQSTLDALADAETLDLYFACAGFPPSLLAGAAQWDCRTLGDELAAYSVARGAARAAFRAVPGLRG